LGLAFCYFDIRQYNLAYSTLKPFIDENRDNLRMQKLFSDTCLALSKKEEALQTLKYLLFLNAKDKEVATAVAELEQEIESAVTIKHIPIIIPEEHEERNVISEPSFRIEKLESAPKENFDDWMTVNLKSDDQQKNEYENRNTNKQNIEWHIDDDEVIAERNIDTTPVVTHTLVDLYCGQGHLEKALEILDKILILNPSDHRTIAKKNEIMALITPESSKLEKLHIVEEVSEEDGRKQLMDFIDEHIHIEVADVEEKRDTAKLEKKYQLFLKKIQKRALDYQTRI
jgi:tetratricopeptide (TPR) repeat protein